MNGYLVNPGQFVTETVEIITEKLVNDAKRKAIGMALHSSVMQRFDINSNIHHYQRYLQ